MIKRHILDCIVESLKDFPAVLLNGARQVGKSTLAEEICDKKIIDHYLTLDDIENLESARSDPDGFINQFEGSIAIDEVQKAPDLLRAIKRSIDKKRTPGRFLLTGSANILSYPGVIESMAGRMDIISLEGLSLGEILQCTKPSEFIEDLFAGKDIASLTKKWNRILANKKTIKKKQLLDIVFFGGYPEVALKNNLRFRDRWFSSYQSAYIERDVRNLSRLLDITSFSKLYKLLGLTTGNLMNLAEVGSQAKLDVRTASRYIEILELTFQLNLLKPWFPNDQKKYVKSPKIYVHDSGQAAYLSGINDPEHLLKHPSLGAIFETWVWSELRKLIAINHGIDSYFYRTYQGQEVDFLLTRGTRRWGIECKWADGITKNDFKGLKNMIEDFDDEASGIVFYTGKNIVPFSDKLIGVPLNILT